VKIKITTKYWHMPLHTMHFWQACYLSIYIIITFCYSFYGTDEDLDSSSGSEEILQRSIWDTPLAASKILSSSSDALISLQNFVEQSVQKFHVDMDVQVKRDSDILAQMIRKYKNPAFNIRKPLNVEFLMNLEWTVEAPRESYSVC
jgi:hypothetical protein